jgi:predicted small secreted protein
MRKRELILTVVFLVLATLLTACTDGTSGASSSAGGAVTQQPDENGLESSMPPSTSGGSGAISRPGSNFDAEKIAEDLIVYQYSYISLTGRAWVFHVIENTSEHTLEISGSLKTYDAAGNILGAKSSSEHAVGSGQRTVLTYLLDEAFDDSKYEITVSEDTLYASVIQDLAYECSAAKNKEIVTITNNGCFQPLVYFFIVSKYIILACCMFLWHNTWGNCNTIGNSKTLVNDYG